MVQFKPTWALGVIAIAGIASVTAEEASVVTDVITKTFFKTTTVISNATAVITFSATGTSDDGITTAVSTFAATIVSTIPMSVTTEKNTYTLSAPAGEVVTIRSTVVNPVTVCEPLKPTATGALAKKLPDDYTWGCAPGFVCDPPKPPNCNLWQQPPPADYVCEPQFCKEAPPIPSRRTDNGYFELVPGYFNLDPGMFGLSVDIFEKHEIVEVVAGQLVTINTGMWPVQAAPTAAPESRDNQGSYLFPWQRSGGRVYRPSKRQGPVPAICFNACEDDFEEWQRNMNAEKLCVSGSAYLERLATCTDCVHSGIGEPGTPGYEGLLDVFKQFLVFCDSSTPGTIISTTTQGPEGQMSSEPTVITTSQRPINNNTSPIPITTSSTTILTTSSTIVLTSTTTSVSSTTASSTLTPTSTPTPSPTSSTSVSSSTSLPLFSSSAVGSSSSTTTASSSSGAGDLSSTASQTSSSISNVSTTAPSTFSSSSTSVVLSSSSSVTSVSNTSTSTAVILTETSTIAFTSTTPTTTKPSAATSSIATGDAVRQMPVALASLLGALFAFLL